MWKQIEPKLNEASLFLACITYIMFNLTKQKIRERETSCNCLCHHLFFFSSFILVFFSLSFSQEKREGWKEETSEKIKTK